MVKIIIEKRNIEFNDNELNLYKENYKINFIFFDEVKNFEEIYIILNDIYNSIASIQNTAYLTKKYINFIYGNQFNLFFDFIINKKMFRKFGLLFMLFNG